MKVLCVIICCCSTNSQFGSLVDEDGFASSRECALSCTPSAILVQSTHKSREAASLFSSQCEHPPPSQRDCFTMRSGWCCMLTDLFPVCLVLVPPSWSVFWHCWLMCGLYTLRLPLDDSKVLLSLFFFFLNVAVVCRNFSVVRHRVSARVPKVPSRSAVCGSFPLCFSFSLESVAVASDCDISWVYPFFMGCKS